jgi:hypothetical protein
MTLTTPDPMGAVSRGVLELQVRALLPGIIVSWGRTLVKLGAIFLWPTAYLDYALEQKTPYYFLPILEEYTSGFDGLIVRPTYACRGEYERIGFFEAPRPALKQRRYKITAEEWKTVEYTQAERELLFYDRGDSKGPYVITVA